MSVEFSTELQRIGQLTTDYILNYPAVVKVSPDYLRDGVLYYVKQGGKRLRPAILLWACEMLGGKPELALPAAAAIELSHTWTLVHDDIIDNDDLRRGAPSMHAYYRNLWQAQVIPSNLDSWSRNLAMLVGDIQQALAFSMLNELAISLDWKLVTWLVKDLATNWVTEVLEGEMLDMEYTLRPLERITEANILSMLNKKTASTLAWCGRTGALIGLNKLEPEHKLVKLIEGTCRKAGLAFQLQDDILGIVGDESQLGKPIGSDIREGKRTILMAYAYQQADSSQRMTLQSILGKATANDAEINSVRQLLQELGALDYVQRLAQNYIGQAQAGLNELPPSSAKNYLPELIDFITQRKY